MKWEYFGTGLALLGIGVTMVLALPPPWWPNMPRWMVRAGLFVGLAVIIYGCTFTAMGIWPDILRPRIWPIMGLALGASVMIVSSVWLFQIQPIHAPATSSTPAPIVHSIELDFADSILPRISPPDGALHLFEIREDATGIQALPVEHQFAPSEVIDWRQRFSEWPIFGISKCEITSTTNESVFDAVIPINFSFREMIPDVPGLPPVEIGGMIQAFPGGIQMRSGRVMATQSSGFRVGRIYPQAPYVIYFVNRTKYLVDIEVPAEGKAQDFTKVGDDFEKKLSMKLGRTTGLHLATSIVAKSPPPPVRQGPSPLNTPEKK